jgi:hypothetical protein
LDSIQQRHTNERAFQEALNDWHLATYDPEAHSRWSQFYANALRDALRKTNNRRKETLQSMTTADWRAAVYRELNAEEWFEEPDIESEVQRNHQPEKTEPMIYQADAVPLAMAVTGNGNGHYNDNGSAANGGV